MAQTVGTHGVAVFTSPSNGDTLDATVVKGNDNNLRSAYVDHDADGGLHVQSSSFATRSSPGSLGRKWLTTDTNSYRLFFDDGSAWYEVSYLSSNGGTVTGDVTVTGTLTASVTGSVTGNASTATALQTARNINGVAFNGTADITVTAAAGTLSGSTLNSGVTASSLTSVGTLSTLAVSGNAAFDTNTLFVDAANNRVGVGTASPGYVLQVAAPAGSVAVFQASQTGVSNGYQINSNGTALLHEWFNAGSAAMTLDRSGNLGLGGVTPSAWTASARAMQIGSVGAVYQDGSGGVEVAQNAYESAVNTYRYLISFNASRYEQQSGQHKWFTAPSGTAGNVISFTQAMTLDANGRLSTKAISGQGAQINLFANAQSSGEITLAQGLATATDNIGYLINRSNAAFVFGTNNTEQARLKSTGQLRFVPLAADPAGAETGDVYYNSSTNKLRVYNGAWVDLH